MMSLIQRNLPAKIVALIAAIILWFFVMNEQNPMMDGAFTVPVTTLNMPEGYKVSQSADEIRIKVRGQRSLFAMAGAEDFKAYVDLQGMEEGRQTMKVQLVLPPGFEFVETSPSTVVFTLEKIIKKSFVPEISTGGAPAPGMLVEVVYPSQQKVTVEGPRDLVNTVAKVAGYIGLSGNAADFTVNVPLMALNAEGREVPEVKVQPASLEASVGLVRSPIKKVVLVKPVVGTDLSSLYSVVNVKTDPVKIEITGDEKLVDNLTALETQVISLADISSAGLAKRDVKLRIPAGITVTNENIRVTIEIAEKK